MKLIVFSVVLRYLEGALTAMSGPFFVGVWKVVELNRGSGFTHDYASEFTIVIAGEPALMEQNITH